MNHPQRLGKYLVTAVLGEGAMGIVYKGYDPDIKRTVALKTIRRQFGEGGGEGVSAAARFRNEAQAAGRLTHPGIVAVYDYGQDEDVAFIAMEYVEGHSLAHYLGRKLRFTDEDIPGVISQVLDALEHAHDQGVWHRDIKPANIIMARNGKLKVADFGIARIEDANLTQASVMIGTPTYMAPEQFLGTTIDRRVDLYATGVLLYILLTGRAPFVGTQEQLMYKIVHEAAQPPSLVEGAGRPAFYDTVIARALAKKPEQRYPTAAAFRSAIENGVGQPIDATVWEHTLIQVPDRPPAPVPLSPGQRSDVVSRTNTSSQTLLPAHWDRETLQQAEASLAVHVGPLASVLVRRAARECTDLPSLYARLADQVSDPRARHAFLGKATSVTAIRTGSGSRTGGGTGNGTGGASASAASGPLADSLLDAAHKLLAQQVGPIAKVMVKKAAARTQDPAAFFDLLAEALPEGAARLKLRQDLGKLV